MIIRLFIVASPLPSTRMRTLRRSSAKWGFAVLLGLISLPGIGREHQLGGSDLVLWFDIESNEPVWITLESTL